MTFFFSQTTTLCFSQTMISCFSQSMTLCFWPSFGVALAHFGPPWGARGIPVGPPWPPRAPLPVWIYFYMCFASQNGPPKPRMRDRRSNMRCCFRKLAFRVDETPLWDTSPDQPGSALSARNDVVDRSSDPPSTRAGGQDDGSLHKLAGITNKSNHKGGDWQSSGGPFQGRAARPTEL